MALVSLRGALNVQISSQQAVKLGTIIPILQMRKAQRSEVIGRGRTVSGREKRGSGWWSGRDGEACSWLSVSLHPEQQAVQGVLCKGDSRQSRLLGLVRRRLENDAQEHA